MAGHCVPVRLPLPVSDPSTPISSVDDVNQTARCVVDDHTVERDGPNRVRKAAATELLMLSKSAAAGVPERVTCSQKMFVQVASESVPDRATRTTSVGGRLGLGSAMRGL